MSRKDILFLALSITLVMFVAGVSGYKYWTLFQAHTETKAELLSVKNEYSATVQQLHSTIAELGERLATTTIERNTLEEALRGEQVRINAVQMQLDMVTGTIGTLAKLNSTDKELLQKYSRVYFLNEHFEPKSLSLIPVDYVFQPEKDKMILGSVFSFLFDMLRDANADGINLRVLSAYRSFGEQSSLKSAYKITYGAGMSNKFSADQGYSEHQLGTTVDFTTEELGDNYDNFEQDKAYLWLTEHACQYGFVLSYPKDNAYYVFEPWHWRFVGLNLAHRLETAGQYFYDMEQRDIDQYLVSLFDN